jgi:hypothetical protein
MCVRQTPSPCALHPPPLDPKTDGAFNQVMSHHENQDVGPDPVWGLGVFIVGLVTMAIGGATTRHWVFNIGEGTLLIGVVLFVAAIAITSHRQEHVITRLKRAFRNDDIDAD